jgi:hypothetical protein
MEMYVYMEMSQGNYRCSYLKQTKCHFSFFPFTNTGEHKGRTGPTWGVYQWEWGGGGERKWESEYSTNIMYTSM